MLTHEQFIKELAYRESQGFKPVTLAVIEERINALGYTLDRSMDCLSNNRHMTGTQAGLSYPAVNMYPIEQDTGKSFANFEARRDENFKALQALRFSGELFAVHQGRIYEL